MKSEELNNIRFTNGNAVNILTFNDVDFVNKKHFDECFDVLKRVVEIEDLMESPFYSYSESISDAKDIIYKLKELRG